MKDIFQQNEFDENSVIKYLLITASNWRHYVKNKINQKLVNLIKEL